MTAAAAADCIPATLPSSLDGFSRLSDIVSSMTNAHHYRRRRRCHHLAKPCLHTFRVPWRYVVEPNADGSAWFRPIVGWRQSTSAIRLAYVINNSGVWAARKHRFTMCRDCGVLVYRCAWCARHTTMDDGYVWGAESMGNHSYWCSYRCCLAHAIDAGVDGTNDKTLYDDDDDNR